MSVTITFHSSEVAQWLARYPSAPAIGNGVALVFETYYSANVLCDWGVSGRVYAECIGRVYADSLMSLVLDGTDDVRVAQSIVKRISNACRRATSDDQNQSNSGHPKGAEPGDPGDGSKPDAGASGSAQAPRSAGQNDDANSDASSSAEPGHPDADAESHASRAREAERLDDGDQGADTSPSDGAPSDGEGIEGQDRHDGSASDDAEPSLDEAGPSLDVNESEVPSLDAANEGAAGLPDEEMPSASEEGSDPRNPMRALPSVRLRRAPGGVFATWRLGAPPSPSIVRRLRAALTQLLPGGEVDPSGRYSARRVALKTAGYLRAVTTADRRLEEGRPAILMMADVSGSMSALATSVSALARAVHVVGVAGAEVVVVVHSNGYPEYLVTPGAKRESPVPPLNELVWFNERGREGVLVWYRKLIARYNVRAIVSAADGDGMWLYPTLAALPEVEHFVWLDPFCSRKDEVITRHRPLWFTDEDACAFALDKLRYAYGFSDVESAVLAIEKLARQK